HRGPYAQTQDACVRRQLRRAAYRRYSSIGRRWPRIEEDIRFGSTKSWLRLLRKASFFRDYVAFSFVHSRLRLPEMSEECRTASLIEVLAKRPPQVKLFAKLLYEQTQRGQGQHPSSSNVL